MTEEEKKAIAELEQDAYNVIFADMCTLNDEFENIDTVLNLIKKQQEEIENKDKIIDEMAETISKMETGIKTIIYQEQEKYCEFIRSSEEHCWKTDKSCKDCIKQHFETIR